MRPILALSVLMLAAAPALATPPDMLELRDTLFGVSAERVFVLRMTRDNYGVYDVDWRDQFLIAIDRETMSEQIWPVYRVAQFPDPDAGPDSLRGKAHVRPLAGAVNPFEVLAHFGALPLTATEGDLLEVMATGDTVQLLDEAGPAAALPIPTALAQLSGALTTLAATIEPYQRMGPLLARDLLTAGYSASECRFSDGLRLRDMLAPVTHLVRMTCAEEPDGPEISLILLLPRADGP